MSLFGNSSKKNSSVTDNTLSNADQTNNQGNLNNGDGDVTFISTDNGATAAAIGSNTVISQSALAANLETTKAALNASTSATDSAFGFGSQALDSNSYIAGTALGLGQSVIDKMSELSTAVLVNGEKATRGALALAKTSTTSEAANITELMVKAGMVLGAIAIIGAVVARGSK